MTNMGMKGGFSNAIKSGDITVMAINKVLVDKTSFGWDRLIMAYLGPLLKRPIAHSNAAKTQTDNFTSHDVNEVRQNVNYRWFASVNWKLIIMGKYFLPISLSNFCAVWVSRYERKKKSRHAADTVSSGRYGFWGVPFSVRVANGALVIIDLVGKNLKFLTALLTHL